MTAKDFLIQNCPQYAEAVENGYDIRMDEAEILMWMQRYRDSAPKSVQLCPKCAGEGVTPNLPMFAHTALNRVCPVCNGQQVFII